MSAKSASKGGRLSSMRSAVAIASCALGLGLVFFGFGAGTGSQHKEEPSQKSTAAAKQPHRPVRAWNMALGNVVVVAQELGFEVKSAREMGEETGRIATRIEGQLQGLREFYRQESEKNPTLLGSLTLQLNVAASGEVTQVKELASRIIEADFKKVVLSEASKWSFQEIVSDSVTINCPLLFVREGMDITTLIQWEKQLGQLADKSAVARNSGSTPPIQERKASAAPKAAESGKKIAAAATPKETSSAAVKSQSLIYQIKYATPVRKEPNFTSSTVATLTIGTQVTLIGERGEWLEIRAADTGLSGFIRKEFVTPLS